MNTTTIRQQRTKDSFFMMMRKHQSQRYGVELGKRNRWTFEIKKNGKPNYLIGFREDGKIVIGKRERSFYKNNSPLNIAIGSVEEIQSYIRENYFKINPVLTEEEDKKLKNNFVKKVKAIHVKEDGTLGTCPYWWILPEHLEAESGDFALVETKYGEAIVKIKRVIYTPIYKLNRQFCRPYKNVIAVQRISIE